MPTSYFRFLPRLLCIFSFALGIFSHISCDADSSSSPALSTGADDVRTIDGTENNLGDPFMGSAGIQLRRIAEPAYNDRVSAPADDWRPHPRDVSNAVVAQIVSIPNDRGLSSMVWQWGQFLDHDISLTPEHEPFEDYSIVLPIGDEIFDPEVSGNVTMPMGRSVYDEFTGTDPSNPRQQMNMITS